MRAAGLALLGLWPFAAAAGEAAVIDAVLTPAGDGTWRIDVTLEHADEGWQHYADRFEILTPDGAVLGTRPLLHPHTDEQPFTRSLSDLALPAGLAQVVVRAHDSVHGYGGPDLVLVVPRP